MSRDELLQLSGVQCIAEVLTHHIEYGRVLLKSDIAGTLMRIICVHVHLTCVDSISRDGPDVTYVHCMSLLCISRVHV